MNRGTWRVFERQLYFWPGRFRNAKADLDMEKQPHRNSRRAFGHSRGVREINQSINQSIDSYFDITIFS